MEILNIITGVSAVFISILLSIALIFLMFKFNLFITRKVDEEKLLLQGNRSVAIVLGSVLISQAILLRHAVYPIMTVLRNSLVNKISGISILSLILYCILFFAIIGILSFFGVAFSSWMFSRISGKIDELKEIEKDNIAVAIFMGAVILAITLIIEHGIADLAKSIIPTVQSGIISIN